MTSRFGKTYSRKGGNNNSKFDEVFSNKRTTLSTKWGETTFMAKLGQKRPNHKPDVTDVPKKPKVDDDLTEDPFGFDSDEESIPISSKNVAQSKNPVQQPLGHIGNVGSENLTPILEANSKNNQSTTSDSTVSSKFISFDSALHGLREKNTNKVEDGKTLHSSYKEKNYTGNVQNFAEDNNTLTENIWDLGDGKQLDSLPKIDLEKETSSSVLYDWEELNQETSELEFNLDINSFSEIKEDILTHKEHEDEPGECPGGEVVQSGLKLGNCRTYCRSNKTKQSQGSSNFDKLLDGTSHSSAKANSTSEKERKNPVEKCSSTGTRSTGRTRDYTVLHPSCLSVCNVTIQDSMERGMDEFTTTPTTDLGEAGRLRKKADIATKKTTTRFRPGNPKSKKDAKLEFFGFDEQDDGGCEEGGSRSIGQSNYRIKYFGFDDLSEEEDDEEDDNWHQKERKIQMKIKSAVVPSASIPPSSGENLDIQSFNNSEFLEDQYSVPEIFKKPASKLGEKNKDGARKIFSGPKRSPTKAVYNARHWNNPEAEELPSVPAIKSQTVQVRPSDAPCPKDDGVFKAPAPPPKVIKTVTIPTQPYQDIVTALKCRKEHKELYTVVQHVKHFNDVVEFGENQEFSDDIEYLLSGLKSSQPINTRCLSVISLATKCAMPSFRMHLRAHGMVAMVFKTLDDSQQHQNLALCTAALMYILSRDRLNMDLDRASLDLMIRLLEMEQDPSARQMNEKEMNKIKEKIRRLCETVHNKHLDLENITAGHLAMETLLSLTSKRAGDWFKEELRLLGGLDHIVDKGKYT
ncbi:hypothetical protein GDO86_013131 [Hymenochirus boettgeri]|uniref:WAPL domain-containing protein n=1 Tax=Hymenochirus boettgeri TaxID=247094 RepID=A0A8T2IQ07_9PIPI|nr:hypothetical protein GDO86_013131 [Hymenochirus boettgeri]